MKIRIVSEAEITVEGTEDPKVLVEIAKRMATKSHVGLVEEKESIFGRCELTISKVTEVVVPRGTRAKTEKTK